MINLALTEVKNDTSSIKYLMSLYSEEFFIIVTNVLKILRIIVILIICIIKIIAKYDTAIHSFIFLS